MDLKKISLTVKNVVEKFLKYSVKKSLIKLKKDKIKETKTLHLISIKAKKENSMGVLNGHMN